MIKTTVASLAYTTMGELVVATQWAKAYLDEQFGKFTGSKDKSKDWRALINNQKQRKGDTKVVGSLVAVVDPWVVEAILLIVGTFTVKLIIHQEEFPIKTRKFLSNSYVTYRESIMIGAIERTR